jgi:hypothetical protein
MLPGDASQLFYRADFGGVTLGMPGVAMVASYLKEKHHLDHLYVCSSLEAFQKKLEEIGHSPSDIRAALVIPWGFMHRTDANANYTGNPGHKLAVCLEKKAGLMKVAIIDSLEEEELGTNTHLVKKGPAQHVLENESTLDIVLWYIHHSAVDLSKTELYYCQPDIQYAGFGCETFSLRTAVSFLRYPHFFDRILTEPVIVGRDRSPLFFQQTLGKSGSKLFLQLTIGSDGSKLFLRKITHLPLPFLKGTQSSRVLLCLTQEYLEKIKPLPPAEELSDLWGGLKKHTIEVEGSRQNHYINRRSFKYHQMVLTTCRMLPSEEIAQILKKTLLTDATPPAPHNPKSPSDNLLPMYHTALPRGHKPPLTVDLGFGPLGRIKIACRL